MGTRWTVKRPTNNNVQCSLVKPTTIFIEPIPAEKIRLLMDEYPHTEWIGYLIGQENKDSGDIFVEDISIPPHEEASGATCLAEPFHIPKKGCVGVIHSHHSMGAFHSGQDDHTVDRNFPISITVAKKSTNLEWDAVSHITTPCGKHSLLKCPVRYVQPQPLFNRKDFMDKAKENIEKGRKVYKPTLDCITKPISYFTDGEGRVYSSKEYEELMSQIWKE